MKRKSESLLNHIDQVCEQLSPNNKDNSQPVRKRNNLKIRNKSQDEVKNPNYINEILKKKSHFNHNDLQLFKENFLKINYSKREMEIKEKRKNEYLKNINEKMNKNDFNFHKEMANLEKQKKKKVNKKEIEDYETKRKIKIDQILSELNYKKRKKENYV